LIGCRAGFHRPAIVFGRINDMADHGARSSMARAQTTIALIRNGLFQGREIK
jgi:hypothetical protein